MQRLGEQEASPHLQGRREEGREQPTPCWVPALTLADPLGSEDWYEGNLSAMLRCVELQRSLAEPPGLAGNNLMQLKVTALASTWLCVRHRLGGGGLWGRVWLPSGPLPNLCVHRPIAEGADLTAGEARGLLGAESREVGGCHGLWAGKDLRYQVPCTRTSSNCAEFTYVFIY